MKTSEHEYAIKHAEDWISSSNMHEYHELWKELDEKWGGAFKVNDPELSQRIARLCLNMMEDAEKKGLDGSSISAVSYIIANFIEYSFGGPLGEAIDLAGQLELPPNIVEGDVKQLWAKMEEYLKTETQGKN